ncbi:unnamed protein product [Trichobilharzia regenti]|nr:unnamed protein product [Trichobilharzia regenti]
MHVCNEIAAAIRPLYPPRVWDELGIVFYVTFWSLQSSDLVVPESAYQRQIQQLKEQIQQIDASGSTWVILCYCVFLSLCCFFVLSLL